MVLNAIGYPKPLTVTGYTSDFFGKDPAFYADRGRPAAYAEKFGVDDFAAGFVRLEGDIILSFRIAWAMHFDTSGDTLIYGTKGGLRIPSTSCWNGTLNKPMTLYRTVCGQLTETTLPLVEKEQDLWLEKARSFLDAIREGGKSPVPSSQIIYNQAILSSIAKSAELGHEIEVEI
jgi:predicted dehydrogenase